MTRRRLHPAGIAIYALATLREAAVPLVAVFVVSALGDGFDERALLRGLAFAGVGLVVAAAGGAARWATTAYWFDPGGIHLRTGLLSRKETDVPFGRVQAVDTEQGPVQRLFGVRALHVQTGGGGAHGEIVLAAVGAREARQIRERLAVARPEAALAPSGPDAERRLTRGELALTALTAGQVGLILPVLVGVAQLGRSLFEGDARRGEEALALLPESLPAWLLAGAALLAAGWLLSVLGSVVAFAGFAARREGERLHIRRGLLARREATIPVERVRAVSVVEGLLRIPLGRAAVRLEVIGHAKEPAAAQTLFPLLRRAEVEPFLRSLLPELADGLEGLAPVPRRALGRYVAPPALAGAGLGVLAWVPGPAGWWALGLALAGAGYGRARWTAAGWRLRDGRLAVRALRLARTTVLARAGDRESHATEQTVLQRRAGLADLRVAFGKGTEAAVRHLDAGEAARLRDALR